MSDRLDRIVPFTFSLLFLILLDYMNTGVTSNLLMRQKKFSIEKVIRLIFDEVIMSDRHMQDRQMYSLLQLFGNTEKIRLNSRLESIITDYVLPILTVILL